MDSIKFLICGDTKAPVRNKDFDCGIDVFVPNLTEQFIDDLVKINPGQPVKWGVVGAAETERDDMTPEQKQNSGMFIYVPPHEDLLIPVYVKARFDKGICLKVENRSGVCVKQKLICGSGIIDPSFQGVIHIHVINYSNTMRFMSFGQKLCQLVPYKTDQEEHEVWYDETIEKFKEFKNQTTAAKFYEGHISPRGEEGFGSTDRPQQNAP